MESSEDEVPRHLNNKIEKDESLFINFYEWSEERKTISNMLNQGDEKHSRNSESSSEDIEHQGLGKLLDSVIILDPDLNPMEIGPEFKLTPDPLWAEQQRLKEIKKQYYRRFPEKKGEFDKI